jgi:hypothetical protein
MDRKSITLTGAIIAGAGIAGLTMSALFVKGMSPVTAGAILGAMGAICLAGVAFGIWDARRIEAKRKAKEQIWIEH